MVKFRDAVLCFCSSAQSDSESESEKFFSDDLIERSNDETEQLQSDANVQVTDDNSQARQKPLVFLSHEGGGPGKITKKGEVDLLHSWLKSKGIPAFLDEYSLQLGDDNAQVMIAAVKEAPVCES
jgi:hypothetical protein